MAKTKACARESGFQTNFTFTHNSYLKKKTEADPLVVFMISSLQRVLCFVNARMCHIKTNPLPEGTRYGIGGVDPAVSIENILWDILGVDAVYGVTNVMFGRHNQTEGKHEGGGDTVMEAEHPAVYVNVAHVEEPTELTKNL